jgi:hypothetical protein
MRGWMLPYIGVEMLFHMLVNSTALDTAREVLTPTELGVVRLNQWVIRGGAGGLYTPLFAGAGSLTASTGAPRPRLRCTREPRRPTWARTGAPPPLPRALTRVATASTRGGPGRSGRARVLCHPYLGRAREPLRPTRMGAPPGAGASTASTHAQPPPRAPAATGESRCGGRRRIPPFPPLPCGRSSDGGPISGG